VNFFLGVDGLSLPLVILNALLTALAIVGGWEKTAPKRPSPDPATAGVMGVSWRQWI